VAMATNPRRHRASAQTRREALLRAAMEVAAERGMAGVSHRAVTEKAGLPLATISYFFDSITELAQEALRLFVKADTAQQLALAESLRSRHSAPADILAAFAETAAPRRPETPALFEVLLHASRSPELRGAVTEAIEAGRHVAEAAACAGGASNPTAPQSWPSLTATPCTDSRHPTQSPRRPATRPPGTASRRPARPRPHRARRAAGRVHSTADRLANTARSRTAGHRLRQRHNASGPQQRRKPATKQSFTGDVIDPDRGRRRVRTVSRWRSLAIAGAGDAAPVRNADVPVRTVASVRVASPFGDGAEAVRGARVAPVDLRLLGRAQRADRVMQPS